MITTKKSTDCWLWLGYAMVLYTSLTLTVNPCGIMYINDEQKENVQLDLTQNSQQSFRKKKQYFPIQKDATNPNMVIPIYLPCRGLLHHWRLWLSTTTRTASQKDEPNKQPNSLSVIWSYFKTFSVEKWWWDCFVCSQTPAAVFPISTVLFPYTDDLGRCTLHLV